MVRLKKVLTKVPGFDIITPALSESTLDRRAANLENDTENEREVLRSLRGSVVRLGASEGERAGERPANSQIRRVKRR